MQVKDQGTLLFYPFLDKLERLLLNNSDFFIRLNFDRWVQREVTEFQKIMSRDNTNGQMGLLGTPNLE